MKEQNTVIIQGETVLQNNNNSNAGNNDNNSGNKGDNGNADQRTVKATKTGDTTNFALYGMAMAAAGAVIATLVYRRKRS